MQIEIQKYFFRVKFRTNDLNVMRHQIKFIPIFSKVKEIVQIFLHLSVLMSQCKMFSLNTFIISRLHCICLRFLSAWWNLGIVIEKNFVVIENAIVLSSKSPVSSLCLFGHDQFCFLLPSP